MTGQDFAVFVIVGAAFVYLVRHWLLTSRGDKSCGGCSGACAKPNEEKLVQIDLGGSWKP